MFLAFCSFEDTDICRQIVSIFKNMFRGAWPRWKAMPPEERKRLWDHFAVRSYFFIT